MVGNNIPTGFQNPGEVAQQFNGMVQAAATNMGRFTVRQDFMPEIGDYLYRNAPCWNRLRKEAADTDVIKEIRQTALPQTGFISKQNLNSGPMQPAGNRNNLADPGQEIKAVSGFVDWSHYNRSLYEQQGRPFGDQVAKDTNDLIDAATMSLEQCFFSGNATTNPLEFNGIARQMPAGHVLTANYTGAEPDNIGQKLCEVVTRAISSRRTRRRITDIWVSGSGWNLLQKEIEDRRLVTQTVELVPGIQVPAIMTPSGRVPITMTPWLDDTPGADVDDPCTLHFYLVDINSLVWKGVVPYGGKNTFNPQIFEVSTQAQNTVTLTEQRMVLAYGTLYAMNLGDGIWRLDVTAPPSYAWSYTN